MDRRAQLRELYGIAFPDELFEFWDWYSALATEEQKTFADAGGMVPVGLCDVLAGRFEGVTLRYPASLHWRFRFDPPEFFTVLSGDTDGLHWGYWFDDPAAPPVVAHNFASESGELTETAPTLLEAIIDRLLSRIEGAEENRAADGPEYTATYDRDIAAMDALCRKVPRPKTKGPPRIPTRKTQEGMGIVVPPATWDPALADATLDIDALGKPAVIAQTQQWIADGKAGVALFHARQLWGAHRLFAMELLEPAYRALGRDALAAIVNTHRAHPRLPSVNVLSYQPGDFSSLDEVRAAPGDVVKLQIANSGVTELPDLSALVRLESLLANMNRLTDLPASLASCPALTLLSVTRNQLAAVPAVLALLPVIDEIRLDENRITAVGDELRGCRARSLDLSSNPLTTLPDLIAELPNLRSLGLSNTKLTHLPAALGLVPLTNLGIDRTPLVALPPDLSGWRGMQRIVARKTTLPASELDRLRAACPDAVLVV